MTTQQTGQTSAQNTGWKAAFTAFLDRRALIMLFLGFSAGIPILLIFSSLSLWLGEAGIDKSAVTFFTLFTTTVFSKQKHNIKDNSHVSLYFY